MKVFTPCTLYIVQGEWAAEAPAEEICGGRSEVAGRATGLRDAGTAGGSEGGGRKQQVHRLSLRGQRVWEEADPGQRPLMTRQKAHLSSGRGNARRTVRIQWEPSKNSAGTWKIFLPAPADYISDKCYLQDEGRRPHPTERGACEGSRTSSWRWRGHR